MVLDKNELNLLCKVQDIQQLPGLPLFGMLGQKESEETKQSLTEKGIMKDDLFTEEGLQLMKVISLYVNATVFLKLGEAGSFARYAKKEYVLIAQDQNSYRIDLVSQDQITVIILSKFHHWDKVEKGKIKKKLMLGDSIIKYLEEHEDAEAIYYYKCDLKRQKDTKAVLFIAEGYLQQYDATTNIVKMYPQDMVQQGIEAIFP